jgi:hypothetical protein
MPMGTEVTVSVQYCYNHQWIEVPLQFVYTGNNRYDLYGMNPVGGTEWESIGYVKFIAQTPTPCGGLPECEYYDDFPILTYEPKAPGYNDTFRDIYPCAGKSCITGDMAAFDAASWHMISGYE